MTAAPVPPSGRAGPGIAPVYASLERQRFVIRARGDITPAS